MPPNNKPLNGCASILVGSSRRRCSALPSYNLPITMITCQVSQFWFDKVDLMRFCCDCEIGLIRARSTTWSCIAAPFIIHRGCKHQLHAFSVSIMISRFIFARFVRNLLAVVITAVVPASRVATPHPVPVLEYAGIKHPAKAVIGVIEANCKAAAAYSEWVSAAVAVVIFQHGEHGHAERQHRHCEGHEQCSCCNCNGAAEDA